MKARATTCRECREFVNEAPKASKAEKSEAAAAKGCTICKNPRPVDENGYCKTCAKL